MVSPSLMARGVSYFVFTAINYLPFLKHGMDLYFTVKYQSGGGQCRSLLIPLICFDDYGTNWLLTDEIGCDNVLVLLATLMTVFHTIVAIYHLVFNCRAKTKDYIAGAEEGCCGLAACMISLAVVDNEVDAHRAHALKWRRVVCFVTAAFQAALVVTACFGIKFVTCDGAADIQRSSIFVFLPVMMINLSQLIYNLWEGIKDGFN
ncbi:uncharacterized protein BJ171DRAFT_445275 [Polychytrium aggregatum]|uniref:uncharacterized protein n=1 Tax=Polychytrium aggregatum TaxID=110093 RepID=UPI0022FF10E2|nr:uncharacterized protein BJ171DRAFT_445275 [Polychytrium aggregatum]KAI9199717.1 hypothetical protein BJ171DRAFT_445275 [Polychytrium aggregatum]